MHGFDTLIRLSSQTKHHTRNEVDDRRPGPPVLGEKRDYKGEIDTRQYKPCRFDNKAQLYQNDS